SDATRVVFGSPGVIRLHRDDLSIYERFERDLGECFLNCGFDICTVSRDDDIRHERPSSADQLSTQLQPSVQVIRPVTRRSAWTSYRSVGTTRSSIPHISSHPAGDDRTRAPS